jgi:hypothetical protein
MRNKNGVDYFTGAIVTREIWFPEENIRCQFCPFCREEKGLGRFWCNVTGKMIYNPFADGFPEGCPAQLTGEIRGKKGV